jgi:hypothetical protein
VSEGESNTTINVGAVKLVLNDQNTFTTPDSGLTVNAVHVTVNALGMSKTNVIVSSAESDISGCPWTSTRPSRGRSAVSRLSDSNRRPSAYKADALTS